MNMNSSLSQLADGNRLLSVEATPVPAPSHAEHQGNHLFVNCLYHSSSLNQANPESVLARAGEDTLAVLRALVANKMFNDIVSVCISFFVDPCTHTNVPKRRLYRYSIFTSSISPDLTAIDSLLVEGANTAIQSSQIEKIATLLCVDNVRAK